MVGNLSFLSKKLQEEYDKKGYLTTTLLDQPQIAALEQIFHNYFDLSAIPTVYNTVGDVPVDLMTIVSANINQICANFLDTIVQNYRIVASIFIVKKSDENSHIGAHIDGSMTLEGYHNIGIWIPLCDINDQTGKICILNNSQHYLPPYSTTFMPHPYRQVEDFVEQNLTSFSVKTGEAFFFNNSILHCTKKNISGKVRIAVLVKLIDANAPLVTAYYEETAPSGQKVKLYQHEETFFLPASFKSSVPPASSCFVRYVPELPKIFTEEELIQLQNQHS